MEEVTDEVLMQNLKDLLDRKNRLIKELRCKISLLDRNFVHEGNFGHDGDGAKVVINCRCTNVGKEFRDAETQTFESDFHPTDSTGSVLDWTTDGRKDNSVSEILQKAIEKQNPQNDYVYDENCNMYFSPSTGYYYDSERNLLYEPYSQTYYKYNTDQQRYEVYAQVSGQENKNESHLHYTQIVSEGVNDLKLSDSTGVNSSKRSDLEESSKETKLEENFSFSASVNLPTSFVESQYIDSAKSAIDEKKSEIMDEPYSSSKTELMDGEYSSPEEGEICEESTSMSEDEDSYCIIKSPSILCNKRDYWAPCIRAIVKESGQQKIGSLILMTCTGGVIGREENNVIHIPDVSISRVHAEIFFDYDSWQFYIADLGSQNGTYINEIKCENDGKNTHKQVLRHGDTLRLGFCKLLIHIHPGIETCNECEPGQVQAELGIEKSTTIAFKSKENKEKERKQQLKLIKKKFGLESMKYEHNVKIGTASENYEDRAETRRKTKGSQNPYEKDDRASLTSSVPSSNKGYKMLKNMGWCEGQSLGSSSGGITEPIDVHQQRHAVRAGLGTVDNLAHFPVPENPKAKKWRKAQKRYLESSNDTQKDPTNS